MRIYAHEWKLITLIFENQWYYGLIPGGGDVTSEHYVDKNNSRSLYVDTSGEEGEMTSISSGVKNTPYFLRTNQSETPHDWNLISMRGVELKS